MKRQLKKPIPISEKEVWAAATKFMELSLDERDVMIKMRAALEAAYTERMYVNLRDVLEN
jgi:hypothetical protein